MRFISMFRRARGRAAQLIVAVDAAERAGAKWVTGDLALPVSAIWGEFSLPAGEYTFIVPSWSPLGVVYVQRDGRDALVVATAVEERPGTHMDELTLVRRAAHYFVQSLELRDPAIVLHFDVPIGEPASPDPRWRHETPTGPRAHPADGSIDGPVTAGV